jgi:two-component system, NtrC family, nitrogen regulation sensor histidine kinase NtrY
VRRSTHEQHVHWLALAGGLPAVVVALLLLWTGDFETRTRWTVGVAIVLVWLAVASAVRERVVRPLQTLSNLLAALREGDYSIRARGASGDDALGLALLEVNALREPLRRERLGAMEAGALLRRVVGEIDVAVMAFDGPGPDARLRLANRAAEALLGAPADRLIGRTARALGVAEVLDGEPRRVLDRSFRDSGGRWELRRSTFRQDGLPMELVVLADLSRALREEERQVWQRLVRVLSHEINNSLAPISSLADSMRRLLERRPRESDADDDLARGLAVIGARSESLGRFMQRYARMARLPAPSPEALDVASWIGGVVALEKRLPVRVEAGPPCAVHADGDQLDQLLINLVTNAVDAALQTRGDVCVGWRCSPDGTVEVDVVDDGPGLAGTANLFVPFYSTKPGGSGIGLPLSRQIAEAHGGTLTLDERTDARGCVARLTLPPCLP